MAVAGPLKEQDQVDQLLGSVLKESLGTQKKVRKYLKETRSQ
jgi:hypothetical protein